MISVQLLCDKVQGEGGGGPKYDFVLYGGRGGGVGQNMILYDTGGGGDLERGQIVLHNT